MDTIKQIIKKFDLSTKKSFGQNYILDQNITNKILKLVNVKNKVILEIGPGPGCLTRSIIEKGAKKIIAVEKDQKSIKALKYQKNIFKNKLSLIEGDFLQKKIFEKVKKEITKSNEKIFVISNLPYNIAIPILSKLLNQRKLFNKLILMFQKEQANRIIAKKKTKEYGRISIIAQWLCFIKKEMNLSPNYFYPKPKINSTILSFEFKKKVEFVKNENFLLEIVKKSFNQRRKTIKKSLKLNNTYLKKTLKETKINMSSRPEELDYFKFIKLSNTMINFKKKN